MEYNVLEQIFTQVFSSSWKGFTDSASWLSAKGKEHVILRSAAKEYRKEINRRYNSLRVFGMVKNIPLSDIYVRVNILEKNYERLNVSTEYLEKKFLKDRFGFGLPCDTWDGIEILEKDSYSVSNKILGIVKQHFEIQENLAVKPLEDKLIAILKSVEQQGQPLTEQQNITIQEIRNNIQTVIQNLKIDRNIMSEDVTKITKNITRGRDNVERSLRDALGKDLYQVKEEEIFSNFVWLNNKYIVLGKPGAGKTTFLKFLALKAVDQTLASPRVPIFISLKDLSESKKEILDYIADEFDTCNFPDSYPFIIKLLEDGKALILLDGLDEVSKEGEDDIISKVLQFSEKYDKNSYVISCRVAAYNYWFEKFIDIQIADFNDEQKEIFINNWFGIETKEAIDCYKDLNANPRLSELASIPLLLTLFCISYSNSLYFPQNRADLYNEALQALLSRWDATRKVRRGVIYKNLSLKRKESLFSRIAAKTFENNQYFFPKKFVEKEISDYIKNLPDANLDTLDIDSSAILSAIEVQHSIILQRAKEIYSFSHLTFQEYYTAMYIVNNSRRMNLHRLVDNVFKDERWREVFLLTIGMLDEAEELPLVIEEKIFEYYKTSGLAELIKLIALPIKKNLPSPVLTGRLYDYCNNILNTRSFKRSKTVDLLNAKTISFATLVNQEILRNSMLDKELYRELYNVLDFDVVKEVMKPGINYGIQYSEDISRCMKLNQLLIDSLSTDGYFDVEIRESILNRMLTVADVQVNRHNLN